MMLTQSTTAMTKNMAESFVAESFVAESLKKS
jgi:hypothetical protein